jgi:hypothetical protein
VWVSFYRGWTPISKTFAAKCVRIFSDAWNMADTLANFDGVVPNPPQAKWLKDLFIRKFGGQIK